MRKKKNMFNEEYLVQSDDYTAVMSDVVIPWLESVGRTKRVFGADHAPIFTVSYPAENPAATVFIVHGFTENAFKFSELIYSLLKNHFDVVAYDQRGHGRSWRSEKIHDHSLTHVDDFREYVRDMEIIVDTVVSKLPKPWMLFSHSMGGAVAGLYLEDHSGVFSRAVFCAPMIQADMGSMSPAVVKLLCRSAKLIGKGSSRVFVSKPYTEKEAFEPSCATGRERFDWYENIRVNRREYQNNGPSYSWTLEAALVTKKLLSAGAPEKIDCPVRLYTAELDHTVLPEPQKEFISRIRNGSHRIVKGAKHEIYRSTDEVLFPWWHDVLSFLKEN